jgi:hypothetical protein
MVGFAWSCTAEALEYIGQARGEYRSRPVCAGRVLRLQHCLHPGPGLRHVLIRYAAPADVFAACGRYPAGTDDAQEGLDLCLLRQVLRLR